VTSPGPGGEREESRPSTLSRTFKEFVASEKAGGFVLLACTVISLALANSPAGGAWVELWHLELVGRSLEHWINDGLMAVFFLLFFV
jgi:NhaA family Na+:H+ antiporter